MRHTTLFCLLNEARHFFHWIFDPAKPKVTYDDKIPYFTQTHHLALAVAPVSQVTPAIACLQELFAKLNVALACLIFHGAVAVKMKLATAEFHWDCKKTLVGLTFVF
ncbi:MAG: hypothetical protein MJE68_24045 [Proteobacteria bacterium]|nr:hypothetical protein [Pseudomonadota bacterium]